MIGLKSEIHANVSVHGYMKDLGGGREEDELEGQKLKASHLNCIPLPGSSHVHGLGHSN